LSPLTAPPSDHPFDAPWQAQAFAMTLALHRAGLFSWPDGTRALATQIATGAPFWDAWVAALETLTVERADARPADLADLAARWQAAARATPHGQPVVLAP